MEKKYFAYFHYHGTWFGFATDNNTRRQCMEWMLDKTPEHLRKYYGINFYTFGRTKQLPKREVVKEIKALFPDLIPVHVIEYHSGPRNPGGTGKQGSRPRKGWTKRDYVRNSRIERY